LHSPIDPPRQRWDLFESLCGNRVRASDAAWCRSLTPPERLAVADDLFLTIRAARTAAGDWEAIEARAWQADLAARDVLVAAFRAFDQARHGTGPDRDAR